MNIVIVGGGLAAAAAATELRASGYRDDIVVLAAEQHLPYERPPLSKGLLLGEADAASTVVHEQAWYDEQQVDLRVGTPAEAIDLDRHQVITGSATVAFDRLLLATGSTARHLPAFDEASSRLGLPVHHLRTLDDADALSTALTDRPDAHLLIVGAGWIGLEVAAAARTRGATVTVVDTAEQPLAAVLGPRLGSLFAGLHRDHGVDLRLGTGVGDIERTPDGRVSVALSDGTTVTPDLVLVGIGAAPAVDLATAAGLPADNGVLVDSRLRTHDPAVLAAGDVASHDHPLLGRRIRVEHWDNAREQGAAAARVMLGGDEPYTRLPYFFSDQYDLGMEYVGHVPAGEAVDVVVRGDESALVLTAFWVAGNRVLAGLHLNDWDAADPIRAIVGREVDPTVLADASVPLPELAEKFA